MRERSSAGSVDRLGETIARPAELERAAYYRRDYSHDATEAATRLRAWDQQYEQITTGPFEGFTTDVWLGPLQLFRERSNQIVYEAGRPWPGSVTFGVTLGAQGVSRFCGRPLGAHEVLVLGPATELDLLTAAKLDIVGIAVRNDWLFDHAADLPSSAASPEALGSLRTVLLKPSSAAGLKSFLSGLFEQFALNSEVLDSESLRRVLRDQILTNLLDAVTDKDDGHRLPPRHQQQRRLIGRAKALALESGDTPVTVAEICRQLRVSRRTLQYAFEQVLDTSPVHYLRLVRLHAVRRALRSTRREELSVGDAAVRWGFWHLSHFAADYRRLFGCCPSETPRPT
jgi:AraC family ethanolamine operon transcriptional activator